MKVEIRCCCEPGRLLGTVDLDVPRIYEGQVIDLSLRPMWSLRPSWEQRDGDLFKIIPAEKLSLPVGFARGWDSRTSEYFQSLAIKSNDTPIQTLRRIATFQEAR